MRPCTAIRPAAGRLSPALRAALSLWAAVALLAAVPAHAATARQIDAAVDKTLRSFYTTVTNGRALVRKADAALVFPQVYKAGFGLGGEYGEGALRIGGRTADYYSTAGVSFGFQLGAQARSVVLLFMDKAALRKFRASEGWKVGVDGSVALVTVGAGAAVDSNSIRSPIIGFIFGNQGLMYNLTLEGTKFTRLKM